MSRCLNAATTSSYNIPIGFSTQQPPGSPYPFPFIDHTHREASPQFTEPFWSQLSGYGQPAQQLFYYPQLRRYFSHPLYLARDMDGETTVMGYGKGSRFRSSHPQNAGQKNGGVGPRPHPRRQEMVRVYNGEAFIGEVPLRVLVRFSAVAAKAFPRPSHSAEGAGDGKGLSQQGKKASDEGKAPVTMAEAARVLNTTTVLTEAPDFQSQFKDTASKSCEVSEGQTPENAQETAPESEKAKYQMLNALKKLVLTLDSELLPTNSAVGSVLTWMDLNKHRARDEGLFQFAPQNMNNIKLPKLVDHYQAALAFDMKPFPRELKSEVMERLSLHPPTVNTFALIYCCLPITDGAVARLINSHMDHFDAGRYSQEEINVIDRFVNSKPDLSKRCWGLHKLRKRQARERSLAEKGAQANATMQRHWEESGDDAEGSDEGAEVLKHEACSANDCADAPAQGSSGRGRRERRRKGKGAEEDVSEPTKPEVLNKRGNGRGPGGKLVTGADY